MCSSPGAIRFPDRHAVVIGGGIAGLLAARVLSDHFLSVSLIERDRYPDEFVFRSGVAQGRHPHVMLTRGLQLLERLLPGMTSKLVERGAVELDYLKDVWFHRGGEWMPRLSSSLRSYSCSRPLLDGLVREAVCACGRVRIFAGHEAVGLLTGGDGRRVKGVKVRERGDVLGENRLEIPADLVVDASGRDSHAPRWLEALGYVAPSETIVNAFVGYSSRVYTALPRPEGLWKGLIIHLVPPDGRRGGVVWPIEEDSWIVCANGAEKNYPPVEEGAFLEFIKSIPVPEFYGFVKDALPLSSIHGFRGTENRWRHFERLTRLPEGFVVLGDAACAFNPVYAQGMTMALLGTLALDTLLARQRRANLMGFSRRFQRELAWANILPWQLAVSADRSRPTTEGPLPNLFERALQAYLERIGRLFPQSPFAFQTFQDVVHMVKSPLALLHPTLVRDALMGD
jgi:2-polyprenyl-6-methoxyphenol hydroxylase-like FAD-dependent oxidoreductase